MRQPERSRSGWAPAALALVLACACGAPRDPIQALLAELEQAAEARDAAALRALLAPGFRGPEGLDEVEAEALARRYLAGYEQVNLDLYDVAVEEQGDAARVAFAVDFRGEARRLGPLQGLLPPEASYRFELELVRSDGQWRVAAAQWWPQAPPGSETP